MRDRSVAEAVLIMHWLTSLHVFRDLLAGKLQFVPHWLRASPGLVLSGKHSPMFPRWDRGRNQKHTTNNLFCEHSTDRRSHPPGNQGGPGSPCSYFTLEGRHIDT
jgi:hypothetical protein